MKFVIIALCVITGTAFAQTSDQAQERAAIEQLSRAVEFLAERNLRCHSKRDCKVIPVGAKACGGPSSYVVTSAFNPSLSDVKAFAQTVSEREDLYNRRYNVFSTCTPAFRPEPKCQFRKCQY